MKPVKKAEAGRFCDISPHHSVSFEKGKYIRKLVLVTCLQVTGKKCIQKCLIKALISTPVNKYATKYC